MAVDSVDVAAAVVVDVASDDDAVDCYDDGVDYCYVAVASCHCHSYSHCGG